MRLDLDFMTLTVDRAHRLRDRAGWLHCEAHDDVLPGRDAAEDAAGVVRQKYRLAVLDADLVGVLLARQRGRRHTGADLDALHRIDRHHCGSQIAIELVVNRLAKPRRDTARDDLDDGPCRGGGLAYTVETFFTAPRH